MSTRLFTAIVVMDLLCRGVAPVVAECPLDHLIVGCNRDGVAGTADDRTLFVDCSQKYRNSGDGPYAHWYYPLRQNTLSGDQYRIDEPGFDMFQSTDEQVHSTYDPNRALRGEANVDYRLIVELVSISEGLHVLLEQSPQFPVSSVGDGFNYSYLHRSQGSGHLHLSYQANDGEKLHWITFRLRDDLVDGEQYEASEFFTVVFSREPASGDLWVDGLVDCQDLLKLSRYWLFADGSRPNDYWERVDTNRNGLVDMGDFARLAENWRVPPSVEPATGWERIETGFPYILMDIGFPQGQSQTGYAVGESLTYGGEGVILKSTDGGSTWKRLTAPGIPGLEAMSFVDLQTGYAAGWDDYVVKTADGGTTWETITVTGRMSTVVDIEFRDPNHGVLLEGANVHVTHDGGRTWDLGTGLERGCFEVTFVDERMLFAAGNDGYICKSADGGHTWTTVHTGISKEPLLGIDFLNADYGMAVGDYSLVVSTVDGGKTWTRTRLPGDMLLHGVSILDERTAYLCGTPEYVFKTTDVGATWKSDYEGNWQQAFHKIRFTADGTGFICGSGGIVLRKAAPQMTPQVSAAHHLGLGGG